jgi:methanogenic corrinoid protein MtbC1
LLLLRRALDAGFSIGQVAAVATGDLRRLIEADAVSPKEAGVAPRAAAQAQDVLAAALEAVRSLDRWRLEALLEESSVTLSRPRLLEGVVVPLLHRIGELWETGEVRAAHEHLASAVVRSFVGMMQGQGEVASSAPRLIATTPAGQLHEMGALLAASVASTLGWAATYLGPNLPAEDIAAAARQLQARAVALSIVYPSTDPRLAGELRRLLAQVAPGALLLVGGPGAAANSALLEDIGAVHVRDIAELPAALKRAERASGPPHGGALDHGEPAPAGEARVASFPHALVRTSGDST